MDVRGAATPVFLPKNRAFSSSETRRLLWFCSLKASLLFCTEIERYGLLRAAMSPSEIATILVLNPCLYFIVMYPVLAWTPWRQYFWKEWIWMILALSIWSNAQNWGFRSFGNLGLPWLPALGSKMVGSWGWMKNSSLLRCETIVKNCKNLVKTWSSLLYFSYGLRPGFGHVLFFWSGRKQKLITIGDLNIRPSIIHAL